jgi:hypothetical protein
MGASVPASRAGTDSVVGDICGRCAGRRRKSGRLDRPTADDHRRDAPPLVALQFVPIPFGALASRSSLSLTVLILDQSMPGQWF